MADRDDALRLAPSSTVQRVAEDLRRAVFEGDLPAGTPLREVAIADDLDVARSTVREALGVLVSEGIATRAPHRGVWISAPDPDSVTDVCRARTVLEIAGVRSWSSAGESARTRVRMAVRDYTRAVGQGVSYQLLNEHHLAVHLSFVGLTGSPRLVAMAEALIAELKVALAQIDRQRRNAHDQAGSHAHLLEMLESGRTADVVAELERHLADAEVAIREALGGSATPSRIDT